MQWAPRAPPALAPGLGARGGSKEADGQEGDDESTARFWFPSPVVDPINVPPPYPAKHPTLASSIPMGALPVPMLRQVLT